LYFELTLEDNNTIDNYKEDAVFGCSAYNRTITKLVYNYSINKFNKPFYAFNYQRRFSEEGKGLFYSYFLFLLLNPFIWYNNILIRRL